MSGPGADPRDPKALAPRHLERLRQATADLSWLLGRGYTIDAALKLVGDKGQLSGRQRVAVRRAACPAAWVAVRHKNRRHAPPAQVGVDGFNALITVERALAGAPLLRCTDGVLRDLAGVHARWRPGPTTAQAIRRLAKVLTPVQQVTWLLDAPVSHSGQLAAMLREERAAWEVQTVPYADPALLELGCPLVTADGELLSARPWWPAIELAIPADAWVVDLRLEHHLSL